MNNQYTEEELRQIYNYFAVNVASEMLLALGFIIVVLIALATVYNLKKTTLVLVTTFGFTTFFIPSGYTLYASPTIAIIGIAGLMYELFLASPKTTGENANS